MRLGAKLRSLSCGGNIAVHDHGGNNGSCKTEVVHGSENRYRRSPIKPHPAAERIW